MTIIILEDAVNLAATWVEDLKAKGHSVVHFIRVLSIKDGQITGDDATNKPSTVGLDTLSVAVCDHLLAFGNLTGGECVPYFLDAGIPCVSTSSGGDITLGKGIHIDKEFILGRMGDILALSSRA